MQWIKIQNIYIVLCFINCFISNEIILQLHGLQQKNHNHNSYIASIQICLFIFNFYSLSILLLKVHHGDYQVLYFHALPEKSGQQSHNTPRRLIICVTCLVFTSVPPSLASYYFFLCQTSTPICYVTIVSRSATNMWESQICSPSYTKLNSLT